MDSDFFRREPIADRGISAIVPAPDDPDRVASLVARLAETLDRLRPSYEIVVIDGGSSDRTREVVAQISAANRRVRMVSSDGPGYGSAIGVGFQAAKYPLIFELDGDERFEFGELERLLAKIDHVDIVCSYRTRRHDTLAQRISYLLYRWFARVIFAVTVRDVDCGFRLYRRVAAKRIPVQSRGSFAHAEILAKATFMNMLISEVQVGYAPSGGANDRTVQRFRQRLADAMSVFRHPQFTIELSPTRSEPAPRAA